MSRSLRRTLFAAFLALSTVSAVSLVESASVAAVAGPGTAFLETKTNKVRELMKAPASADREKKVDTELRDLIDFDEMARTALGAGTDKDFYAPRTKEELAEFTDILRRLVEKNYKKHLSETLDYDITFESEEPQQNGDTLVRTLAKSKSDMKKPANKIDYRLRKKGAGFIVVDMITEESSMGNTFRKDFKKVIEKDGYPALVKKLKDKLAKS